MRRASAFIIAAILAAAMLPLAARDGAAAQGFATNTPPPTLPALATNTPPPPVTTPAAPPGRFALRAWAARDLAQTLAGFVGRLRPGDSEGQRAVALLQHELRRRFLGALRDAADRAQLVAALLAAPPGSVDARAAVRPQVAALLAQRGADEAVLELDGFSIEILPANLDGSDPADAVIHVRYPADPLAAARYVDYMLARADADGRLTLLESDPPLPAAPLNDISDLLLLSIADRSGDGLDEVALTASVAGEVNRRLYLYGLRGGQAVSLVEPGREIVYGALDSAAAASGAIRANEYRVESQLWNCLSQRLVTWTWEQNFWRPAADSGGFALQPTTACRLYDAGPYYDLPPGDAIARLDAIVATAPPEDAAAVAQAQVLKAMLYALAGQPEIAAAQMRAALSTGSAVAAQVDAFFAAAAAPDARPIHLCAALEQAGGACDVDLALARLFADAPLRRDRPVVEQLAERGIAVQEALTLAQVGRAARELVRFDLGGERWWAFAPLDPDVFTAERSAPADGSAAPPPPALSDAVPALYRALLDDDSPARALSALETALSRSPGAALTPELLYLRAYSYDLLGDRTRARDGYYALWQGAPRSVWGQLAAAHLEQR